MGSGATEGAVKAARHPQVLHIATHGYFLPDAPGKLATNVLGENPLLRSGLILAGVRQRGSGPGEDGVLTALEVTGLNLLGTKLVVLSACETALGFAPNGEGVYGLRRALVLAGSESQVMSLWKISDSATTDFMVRYYKRLEKTDGRTAALRAVQLALLSDAATSHPYYWAAFIQSGEWRPL